jgi:hypothetical protein
MGQFSKYGGDIVISISGEELRLKRVKTEKLQKLFNLSKDEDNTLKNIVEYFTEMVSSNYPNETLEDVESFVQANAMSIFEEFQIAYGLVKRNDLEERKKEILAKQVQPDKNGK